MVPTSSTGEDLRDVLIVEDDAPLRAELIAWFHARKMAARGCATVREALACLARRSPAILLVDVRLPDGSALELLRAVRSRTPTPLTLAMSGVATPGEAFALANLGVRAFLPKPFDARVLANTLQTAQQTPPETLPHIRTAVGHVGLKEMESQVRQAMVGEALSHCGGNRRAAARLLRVSRQFLQHVLRKLDEG